MTIEEMFRRIVRGHLGIILLCILIALGATVAYEQKQPADHAATLRIQVVASPASSSTEADALSSRVLALATAPSMVRAAIIETGVDRQVDQVATHEVTAQRLGESSVVDLSVTDPDVSVARQLVTSLTKRVVRFMNSGDQARSDKLLRSTDARIAHLGVQQSDLLEQMQVVNGINARANIKARLDAVAASLNQLATQRASLVVAQASEQQVTIVDRGAPDVKTLPTGLYPMAALSLLLGLILGLALAVTIETLRPRLSGIRSLAKLLHAPVIGSTEQPTPILSNMMSLAARRQGVETVVLLGMEPHDEEALSLLLEELPTERTVAPVRRAPDVAPAGRAEVAGAKTARSAAATSEANASDDNELEARAWSPGRVRFTSLDGIGESEEHTAGVVVASTGHALHRRLDAVHDVLEAMRWPVIGVVKVETPRGWWRR
jgi:capsular polysaccharide biosynthesis protein